MDKHMTGEKETTPICKGGYKYRVANLFRALIYIGNIETLIVRVYKRVVKQWVKIQYFRYISLTRFSK